MSRLVSILATYTRKSAEHKNSLALTSDSEVFEKVLHHPNGDNTGKV